MRALLTMLAAATLAAGCGGSESAPSAPSAPAEAVVELSSRAELAQRFDADRGKPRLLLILSPT